MLALETPSRRHRIILVAFLLATLLAYAPPPSTIAQSETTTLASVGRVQITVEPGSGTNATMIADAHGQAITDAWPQFAALFGSEPATPQFIAFVNTVDPAQMTAMRWITDFAYVSPDGAVGVIATAPFLALTPIEAANILRNVVSRGFIQAAAGGAMPPGLLDGIARYVEVPVIARQARLGSLVQGLDQSGTLPNWSQIVTATAPELHAETQTANAYALVAFLTERYGVAGLRNLVSGFQATPDWQANLGETFGQSEQDLATAWNQFLPRWFASGWRDNAVSAFDLTRAETLFNRGAYAAAMAEAERSQRLFNEIEDQVGLGRVETLLAQCAVGLQADAIMIDAQKALEANKYPAVLALVAEAKRLYGLLPEEHRPTTTIDSYTQFATSGDGADAQLAQARDRAGSWLSVTSARADAVAAGDVYAFLGNDDGVTEANMVVSGIDSRIQRMLFVLSALVIVLTAWLGAWLWLRAPDRLQWHSQGAPSRSWRVGEGGN